MSRCSLLEGSSSGTCSGKAEPPRQRTDLWLPGAVGHAGTEAVPRRMFRARIL